MTAGRVTTLHQLKITIEGTKPPIWRRLLVPSENTLGQLHRIIQAAFGWEGYHLHQFTIGDVSYTDPTMMGDLGNLDEEEATLAEVAPPIGLRFVYEYDFGDGWRHMILVEQPKPDRSPGPYPFCTGGKLAGPPEDCGGVWGYATLCDALADPTDPEHERWREWLGEQLRPRRLRPRRDRCGIAAARRIKIRGLKSPAVTLWRHRRSSPSGGLGWRQRANHSAQRCGAG